MEKPKNKITQEIVEEERRAFTFLASIIITLAIFNTYPIIDWTTTIIKTILAILNLLPTMMLTYKITPFFINLKNLQEAEQFYNPQK